MEEHPLCKGLLIFWDPKGNTSFGRIGKFSKSPLKRFRVS
jgi:hypothetical protein